MRRRFALASALALALAGCATHAGRRGAPAASASPGDGIPLGALPRQALGRVQCGLFLWKTGEGARLVLMANSGPPPFARVLLDNRVLDLPRLGDAPADFATDATARYGDRRTTILLDLALTPREGLSDGVVASGSIRVERVGGEGFIVPVSGLLACG